MCEYFRFSRKIKDKKKKDRLFSTFSFELNRNVFIVIDFQKDGTTDVESFS